MVDLGLAKPDEGAHDRDVDVNRAPASQHARKHRHAMFGERVRPVPASTTLV